ncbi:MAG TPA: hypothetical protein VG722_00875, partial [Tepidisphaeraceae bacterium]|nr:hypothetical protein [Tepidisphaeraceae bacterium]
IDEKLSPISPIEVEESAGVKVDSSDRRLRMEEPPPVGIIAVADVVLPATRGLEKALDEFYRGILEFVREGDGENLVYRADNFGLRFQWYEGLVDRQSLRPIGIEVESLGALQRKLFDREIEFQFDRGLVPGSHSILVSDPAGNGLQIYERRSVG